MKICFEWRKSAFVGQSDLSIRSSSCIQYLFTGQNMHYTGPWYNGPTLKLARFLASLVSNASCVNLQYILWYRRADERVIILVRHATVKTSLIPDVRSSWGVTRWVGLRKKHRNKVAISVYSFHLLEEQRRLFVMLLFGVRKSLLSFTKYQMKMSRISKKKDWEDIQ